MRRCAATPSANLPIHLTRLESRRNPSIELVAAVHCRAIASKKQCAEGPSRDLRVRLAPFQRRNEALRTRIVTARNCNAIVTKKYCVPRTSRNLHECSSHLQSREIAFSMIVAAERNCSAILQKHA